MLFLLLFVVFVAAEKDCYLTSKAEILPCVSMADTNHDNIVNKTEITNFLNLYNIGQWKAETILMIMGKSITNGTLTINDWNTIRDPFRICMVCKHNVGFWNSKK